MPRLAEQSAADLLRQARSTSGLTQVELAARAGVTQSVISAYESGRREPALSTLQRLLAAAGQRLPLVLEQVEVLPRPLPRTGLGATVRRRRRQLRRIVAQHGGGQVWLFGSAARGDDGPDSDVDLLVELPADVSLVELGQLSQELEALLGTRVDVVPERSVKPAVRGRIAADLVLV